jgi:Fe-S-cluster-containing hydrogenase component 2
VFNPKRARLTIESGYNAKDEPHVCFQCEDAPCAEVCPTDAIVQKSETGIWEVSREKCTACGECIDANYVLKCELCSGTPCVQECPNDALCLEG